MEARETTSYPVRYEALQNPGILFVRPPGSERTPGCEEASFYTGNKAGISTLYGEVFSYQTSRYVAQIIVGNHKIVWKKHNHNLESLMKDFKEKLEELIKEIGGIAL